MASANPTQIVVTNATGLTIGAKHYPKGAPLYADRHGTPELFAIYVKQGLAKDTTPAKTPSTKSADVAPAPASLSDSTPKLPSKGKDVVNG